MGSWTMADILPLTGWTGGDSVKAVQALFVLLAVGILCALAFGARLYRRWSAAQLSAFADVDWSPPSVVEEGMPARIETPSTSGIRHAQSIVRSVNKRWIALTAPDGVDAGMGPGAPIALVIEGPTALYRFHSDVVDRRTVGGVATLFVAKPVRVEKVQRREHFRVSVHLPTAINVLGTGESEVIRGDIDNLSGGGFRMALPVALQPGCLVRVRLPVVTLLGYSFDARVVRCTEARDFGPMRYRASLEFVRLPEETRNLIVGYCFDVQRESRGPRAGSR